MNQDNRIAAARGDRNRVHSKRIRNTWIHLEEILEPVGLPISIRIVSEPLLTRSNTKDRIGNEVRTIISQTS